MANSAHLIRLCERCWNPIPADRPCRVIPHLDQNRPFLHTVHSYEHTPDDPSCGAYDGLELPDSA